MRADTLVLHNGDRLTGVIQACFEGKIFLATEYAGQLPIDLGHVKSVEDAPNVTVHVEDGRIVHVDVPEELLEPKTEGEAAEEKKWTGALDALASLRDTESTETIDANLGLTLERKWEVDTLTLEVSGAYGEVDSQVNTRRIAGGAKWKHFLSDRLYLLGYTGGEHDPARRLDLRLTLGGGAGYEVLQSDTRKLCLEGGLEYAYERWNRYSLTEYEDAKDAARAVGAAGRVDLRAFLESMTGVPPGGWTLDDITTGLRLLNGAIPPDVDQDPQSENIVNLRLGADYEQTLFKKATLAEKLSVSPRIDDFSEYRLLSDLSLTTPLSERISLRINLKSEYDSDTTQGDDEFTNTLLMGLRYAF